MPSKSKQKQSQKQEQNVKVVINQNDSKSKKKSKRRQTRRTAVSQQGPVPIGVTPAQAMRNFQTFTPQVNNNAAADFSSLVNALRANLAMPMAMGMPAQPIQVPAPPIQVPAPVQPVQPVRVPAPVPVASPLAIQTPVPSVQASRMLRTPLTAPPVVNTTRPPPSVPRLGASPFYSGPVPKTINTSSLASMLKNPSAVKGQYQFDNLLRDNGSAMVHYNSTPPQLSSSIVFDDDQGNTRDISRSVDMPPVRLANSFGENVVHNVPFSPIEQPAKRLRNALSNPAANLAANTIPRKTNPYRATTEIMEAGKDLPEIDYEIMGAATNEYAKKVPMGTQIPGLRYTKAGLPDRRQTRFMNPQTGIPIE